MKRYLFAVLILVLLGSTCIGGQEEKTMTTVYCFGDSLTYGYPTYNRYETTLLGLLGTGWSTVNKGIIGDTTTGMLARFNADVLSHHPDWVIIWGGVNDARASVSAASIESNLQSMYSQAHNAGIKVVAVNIAPFKANQWSSSKQTVVDTVNGWIANTGTGIDFRVDVYSVLENPNNPDCLLSAYDSGDNLHLANAGYDKVAETIYPIFSIQNVIVQLGIGRSGSGGISLSHGGSQWDEIAIISPKYVPGKKGIKDGHLRRFEPKTGIINCQLKRSTSRSYGIGVGLHSDNLMVLGEPGQSTSYGLPLERIYHLPFCYFPQVGTVDGHLRSFEPLSPKGSRLDSHLQPFTPLTAPVDANLQNFTPVQPITKQINLYIPLNIIRYLGVGRSSSYGLGIDFRADCRPYLGIGRSISYGKEWIKFFRANPKKFAILIAGTEIGHIRTVPHRVVDRVKSHG